LNPKCSCERGRHLASRASPAIKKKSFVGDGRKERNTPLGYSRKKRIVLYCERLRKKNLVNTCRGRGRRTMSVNFVHQTRQNSPGEGGRCDTPLHTLKHCFRLLGMLIHRRRDKILEILTYRRKGGGEKPLLRWGDRPRRGGR